MFAYMTYPSQFIRQIQSYKKRRERRNEENELRGKELATSALAR